MTDTDREELSQRLREHIAAGRFPEDSAAYYLAKQVADEGKESLLAHQLSAWDTLIQPLLDAPAEELRRLDEEFARRRAKG